MILLYLCIGFITGVFITTNAQDFYKTIHCNSLTYLINDARKDESRYKNKITKANYGGLAVGLEQSKELFCDVK